MFTIAISLDYLRIWTLGIWGGLNMVLLFYSPLKAPWSWKTQAASRFYTFLTTFSCMDVTLVGTPSSQWVHQSQDGECKCTHFWKRKENWNVAYILGTFQHLGQHQWGLEEDPEHCTSCTSHISISILDASHPSQYFVSFLIAILKLYSYNSIWVHSLEL